MRFLAILIVLVQSLAGQKVALDAFLEDGSLKTASVGVYVLPVKGGEPVMAWEAERGLMPASTMKAVTTATALQLLGEDYLFETKLYLAGDDLVIKGGGDPTLGGSGVNADFPAWLAALKKAGVTEVVGDVVGDSSYFESQTTPNDWPWGDVGNYYGAGPSGLNFHKNTFSLTFETGRVGSPAKLVKTWPVPPGVEFENHMRTGSAGSGDRGYVYGGPGALRISMRGTVPAGGRFQIKGALPDPPLMCATAFKTFLEENGIKVKGAAKVGVRSVKEAKLLHTQKSPSLERIMKGTNHRSVNLYADTLFKALTKKGTTKAAAAAMRKHWRRQGVDLTGFVPLDGSGLSPRNTITAKQLVEILQKARLHESGELFKGTLPVAGRSGTVSTLGRGTAMEGKVWAKSGSLTRVRCYAGYLTGNSGREYAFAVLTNNYVKSPKGAIVKLLSAVVKGN